MRTLRYVAILLTLSAVPAHAADTVTTPEDRRALTLTVYQQNLALVQERRRVELPAGRGRLAVVGVPAQLMPETALARGASPDRIRVLGQVYENALLTPEALLRAAVGSAVQVVTTDPQTGAESFAPAELLRAQGREAMLRIGGRIRTMDVSRIAFASAPAHLRAHPTLVLDLNSASAGPEALSLSYLTGGLHWRADYVARLSENETELALTGWVTLTNGTEAAFENARLRVVAGVLNRAARPVQPVRAKAAMRAMTEAADAPVGAPISDLQLFDFPAPVSIRANEKRQLALLSAPSVKVVKEYRLVGSNAYFGGLRRDVARTSPEVRYLLENTAAAGLGRPLPGGVVRLYVPTNGGELLRGEDSIRHTPNGESVTLTAGLAADITSERRQTAFKRDGLPRNVVETAHAIVLRNAKPEPVTVSVLERFPGDWRILSESAPHEKRSSAEAVWRIPVPAGGTAELTYRLRIRF